MRAARDEDAAWLAELLSRHAPEPATADTVVRAWSAPGIDRDRDVRVDATGGVLVDVEGDRAFLSFAGDASPELLAWAEARAREAGAVRALSGEWEGSTVPAALEAGGYRRSGTSVRMRIDLDAEGAAASWPDGVAVRTFRDGDAEAVYRVHLETFADMSEPMRAGFEEWSHFLLRPPVFEPELWFLAEAAGDLVGIALCHRQEEIGAGKIDILGVRRPWRGRGLGRALLEHAFAEFRRRGVPAAILGAESSSPTGADRLYRRAGMRVTHRRLRYERALA